MLYLESFAAGQTKRFAVPGNFFRVKRVSGVTSESVDVVFFRDGQRVNHDLTDADAGDGIGPLPQGAGFDYFEITSAVAQSVSFDVARGLRFSQRVVGEVSVIDGGKARTLSNQAFLGPNFQAAVAAEYAHVQWKNPAASGIRSVIKSIFAGVSAASLVHLYFFDVDLTVANGVVQSKANGGAAGLTQCRLQSNAVLLGTTDLGAVYLGAGASVHLPLQEPLVLAAGEGVILVSFTPNVALATAAEVVEEPL